MIARAPGKVVLSGAYAVLHGAPAIVTAVSRYVTANTSRPAAFVTPEVCAALGDHPAPWFDAGPLREGDRKLGLGSSAAIVVASLGALHGAREPGIEVGALRRAVFEPALRAHAAAQGGGSGVDVATSVHGGTLSARRTEAGLSVAPLAWPAGLHLEVWFAGVPAFFTMDAGPHVKVVTSPAKREDVAAALADVPGVLDVIRCLPGPDASVALEASA